MTARTGGRAERHEPGRRPSGLCDHELLARLHALDQP